MSVKKNCKDYIHVRFEITHKGNKSAARKEESERAKELIDRNETTATKDEIQDESDSIIAIALLISVGLSEGRLYTRKEKSTPLAAGARVVSAAEIIR